VRGESGGYQPPVISPTPPRLHLTKPSGEDRPGTGEDRPRKSNTNENNSLSRILSSWRGHTYKNFESGNRWADTMLHLHVYYDETNPRSRSTTTPDDLDHGNATRLHCKHDCPNFARAFFWPMPDWYVPRNTPLIKPLGPIRRPGIIARKGGQDRSRGRLRCLGPAEILRGRSRFS
jgi:hypothetical protein